MPVVLLAFVEQLVLSPVVQEAAWSIIKPHLAAGTTPSDYEMVQAQEMADMAHKAAQGEL